MFEAYHSSSADPGATRRAAASTALATLAYLAAAAIVVALASRVPPEQVKKLIDVSFQKPPARVLTPPPPPPPPRATPRPRRKVALPAAQPAPRIVVPKEIPKQAVVEAEPTDRPAAPVITGGIGGGGPGGAGSMDGGIDLPEEATAPQALTQDLSPLYPEQARAAGKEGLVILKFVVLRDGRVGTIKVLKGESPFVEAAIAKVKTILFRPATLNGAPIAVFKIMKFPFRLSVGG